MYKASHKRPNTFDFDLIVIGSGSGGGVAAHIAAKAGKKVAIVEMEKFGGECPNFGCVPTKALLQAAETYKIAKEGSKFGVLASEVRFDYSHIKAWKETAVRHTGTDEGETIFHEEGITVLKGHAHFLSPWTLAVGQHRHTAKHFLIASGAKPVVLPIPGLVEAGFITYREAIDLTDLPESLFVIGGGAIGCEFTELFSSFGCKVHIADITERLIAGEDSEVGEQLQEIFESRGVSVYTCTKVTRVTKEGKAKVVHFEKDGRTHQVKVAEVLLASGKAPNTDLGLENAGVTYNRGGIIVKSTMQTSAKHIYAAGDVVGPYRFTHMASYQSRIAAHNLFHEKHRYHATYNAVPRCVFVDPEIACVGMTERQLEEKGINYQVGDVPISIIGRSNTSDADVGFVKVLADERGRLLGASIVSPRAGEMIHELSLAIHQHLTARAVAETIHAFPTWSEAVRLACQKIKTI